MTSVINLFRIAIVGLLLPVAIDSNAQNVNTQLRSQIDAWTDQIAVEAKEMDIGLEPGTVADCYIYIQRMESFKALRTSMLKEWRLVFQDLNAYAPNDYTKTLLILSLRDMPAEEYYTFMERALDLAVEKKLSLQLTRWVIYPSAGPNMALLINSYDDKRARAVMLKAKQVFADDSGFVAGLDKRLSGRVKAERDEFIRQSTGKPLIPFSQMPGSPNPAATPVPSPTATPTTLQPSSTPTAQTPVAVVERKSRAWPWLVGIAAFAVIAFLVWKRRA